MVRRIHTVEDRGRTGRLLGEKLRVAGIARDVLNPRVRRWRGMPTDCDYGVTIVDELFRY
jgi:hypothetical protein